MAASVIRRATHGDIPSMVAMGAEFHAEAKLPMPYNAEKVQDFLAGLVDGGGVFVCETGMIGGALVHPYCTDNWTIAVELFWWARGGGTGLLRAFEAWASENGANEVRMTTLASLSRAERLLDAVGYAKMETSHTRVM